jgi:superoxide dismutase, Fe-Mn family
MFKLPEIDFSKAPFLSAETLEYHYGKHHKAYVDNLNKLTKDLPKKGVLEIVGSSDGALFNNAAQTWNHTFYWLGLTPSASEIRPDSPLAKSISTQFGSMDGLKEKFLDSATKVFGSGWTWLALNRQTSSLEILNTSNADTVDFKKYAPVMICDVWEHAYYIEYRNSRANYLAGFWKAINWQFVESNFDKKSYEKIDDLLQGDAR